MAQTTKKLPDSAKRRPPAAGKGRPKGARNKTTTLLKDAILMAAAAAGGKEGLVGYLTTRAKKQPGPFLALLGKVLPIQTQHSGAIGTYDLSNASESDLCALVPILERIANAGASQGGAGSPGS
jgi:hypothetical protein